MNSIRRETISTELEALLGRATTPEGRVTSYFEDVREPASTGPRVRCLVRHPNAKYPRDAIRTALVL